VTDPERATMQCGEVLDEGLSPSNRPDSPRPSRMKSVRKVKDSHFAPGGHRRCCSVTRFSSSIFSL